MGNVQESTINGEIVRKISDLLARKRNKTETGNMNCTFCLHDDSSGEAIWVSIEQDGEEFGSQETQAYVSVYGPETDYDGDYVEHKVPITVSEFIQLFNAWALNHAPTDTSTPKSLAENRVEDVLEGFK